ncbi:bifunctional phosphopantothenoylcysteine decarboxylase/phosphopantothenate--cysteine ligase CoaBC [Streptomyces sp. XM4011]|uniref:bifunctional phosphopantothenoylcysteine decarboxylase/phosphopantothenate--cysteine ligase CoaBC n=1 Tax=Streptomyces sp. XM4011 TaxID=2929780 RepID=UPI001FFB0AF1|nr:bifunctional phosphopantothenoylcysteine decarboxylase/phosphopantothenate--cysteine ligase CoaBC [Streptomyces sp. XM4011]MCK1813038.1 bifunctional phosphopantothenoylcysteine decarboxylase/phosphopantothenate--cysteine ligase CoaBC [Streptomyces sp. XM4011]
MDKPKVVLGVSGGIAAYKACELLRRLTESGHDVRVLPTANALRFVGAPTWAALSGHPVETEVFEDVHEVPHVRIGQQADLLVIAPATADLLAKAAHGRADDLLTNTLLTVRAPVVFAPAMHTEMWEHPATRENVATLRRRGAVVIEPASGRLTGADTGKGRLPDPAEIFEVCRRVLARGTGSLTPDLAGRHVVISAGGTREPLDPVRYLGNRSSGKQGYALARTAVARGARVTLVAANTALPDPAGAEVVPVGTARELQDAVVKAAIGADVVVMAAAVADFRPAQEVRSKIKKRDGVEPEPVALVRNPDILAQVAARHPARPPVVVGFAAETDDVLAGGRAKLARKGCDLLVVNQVGDGRAFGTEENEAVILEAGGPETPVPYGPKEALADRVWDAVARRLTTA